MVLNQANTVMTQRIRKIQEPEITFRFFRDRDSFSQVTLCFYAYNSTSCLVTLDGVSTVTVKRETAAELVSSVKNILK